MNLLIDIEGLIVSNEIRDIIVVPTELSYMIYSKKKIYECSTMRLEYNLNSIPNHLWCRSYNYVKNKFPNTFKGTFNKGENPKEIQSMLMDKIKKNDLTICAKGLNLEVQFLFGDLDCFHKPVKISDLDNYSFIELNNLHLPKYDHIQNKKSIIESFYKKHKKIIKSKLYIEKEDLFENNIDKYIDEHYSILEIIVFYEWTNAG